MQLVRAVDMSASTARGHGQRLVQQISPSPYNAGLVRSGVAPDHPEVKSVQNDFETVAKDSRFGFLGNVGVDRDVSVTELQSLYDVVVLAYGAAVRQPCCPHHRPPTCENIVSSPVSSSSCIVSCGQSDRRLNIPGENLHNVLSARAFVNWYNGHPEFVSVNPGLDTVEDVVVIGNGNVAIDCARILCKSPSELQSTDIAQHAVTALKNRWVHVSFSRTFSVSA
jgi:adrenodoxin-NADP+ reductase